MTQAHQTAYYPYLIGRQTRSPRELRAHIRIKVCDLWALTLKYLYMSKTSAGRDVAEYTIIIFMHIYTLLGLALADIKRR